MGKFKIPPDGTKSRRTLNEIISKPRLWYTNLVGEVTNFRGGSLVYEQGLVLRVHTVRPMFAKCALAC